MATKMVHPGKLLLFVLLSMADLFLTWLLVTGTGGQVYESNPVANYWLASYGWLGLGVFKAGMVSVVSTLVLVISRYRPRTGERVLLFACSTLTVVVLYSCFLAWSLGLPNHTLAPEEIVLAARLP
jgi:hypothetical protein